MLVTRANVAEEKPGEAESKEVAIPGDDEGARHEKVEKRLVRP